MILVEVPQFSRCEPLERDFGFCKKSFASNYDVNLKRLFGTAGALARNPRKTQHRTSFVPNPCSRFALIAGEGARGPSKS